jgi:excisionase family DNA binding protein
VIEHRLLSADLSASLARMAAYLSARQAADLCGVSERTIRNWITSGKLSGGKVRRYFPH